MSQSVSRRRPIWARRSSLLLYFVLAFVLSWWVWPLRLLNPESSPQVPFGPTLAAFVVAALVEGRRSVLHLLRQLARWRVHVVWYLVALTGPFALTTLAATLTVAAGAPRPTFAGYLDWPVLLATVGQTAVIVGLFEEPGWRGFALPRMQRSLGALRAALVLGVIWVLWHLPLLISAGGNGQRPWAPFTVWAVAESVILAWLYNGTGGSLPIVILFHAGGNTALRYLLPEFTGGYYALSFWALAAVNVAVVVVLVRSVGPDLSRNGVEKTVEGAFSGEARTGPGGMHSCGRRYTPQALHLHTRVDEALDAPGRQQVPSVSVSVRPSAPRPRRHRAGAARPGWVRAARARWRTDRPPRSWHPC